jgi:hypothetical protein
LEPITALSLVALVAKLIDFFRYASARDRNGVVTQAAAWAAGVAVAFLAAAADLTAGLTLVGDVPLGSVNGWSLVLVGVSLASLASAGADYKRARDGRDSAAVPTLLNPSAARRARRADVA